MIDGPDARTWMRTDRKGELVTIGQPVPGVEVLSALGTTRHWAEPMHETFTVCAVHDTGSGADWRTRGRAVTTTGGQLMTINAGDGHATSRVFAPARFDAVRFAPAWIEKASADLEARQAFRFRQPTFANPAVFAAIERLMQDLACNETPFVLFSSCEAIARAIVSELSEGGPPPDRRPDEMPNKKLERIREYLIESTETKPTLVALEAEFDIGRSQLCARFKDVYGLSIGQYWRASRLAKARRLLLEGMQAKEVTERLDFTDEAHFSRTFRKQYGLPPAVWVSMYKTSFNGRRPVRGQSRVSHPGE